MSLAEAFFARGIQNYIGAGWEVNDKQAQDFAAHFYRHALGLLSEAGNGPVTGWAPPNTLGVALQSARRSLLASAGGPSSTWGAYQHYGQVNAKLLAFRNQDEKEKKAGYSE